MFASETTVSPEKTQCEILETLKRYGAAEYTTGWVDGGGMVQFKFKQYMVRLRCGMPDPQHKAFVTNGRGQRRTGNQAARAWEQAVRQKWRALLLILKAKLESVTAGVFTFEQEFLACIVTRSGATVLEAIREQSPTDGTIAGLLPAPPSTTTTPGK